VFHDTATSCSPVATESGPQGRICKNQTLGEYCNDGTLNSCKSNLANGPSPVSSS